MSKMVQKVEPSNHMLYPNKFFTVVNHTPDTACILVYPTTHKFRTRPSHVSLRAGMDGFEVAVHTVQVTHPPPLTRSRRTTSRSGTHMPWNRRQLLPLVGPLNRPKRRSFSQRPPLRRRSSSGPPEPSARRRRCAARHMPRVRGS